MRNIALVGILILAAGLWVGCESDVSTTTPEPVQVPDMLSAAPEGMVQMDLPVRASVRCEAEASGCSNNPGPFITLTGELALGGLDARLIFRNADKGPHEHIEDVQTSVVILPAGEEIRFAKQPPQGGAGGNPWIFLLFTDEHGNEYGEPLLLGRCVQGLTTVAADVNVPSSVWAQVLTGGCSNNPGPYITLDGEIGLGGLNARLVFTNNRKFRHVHEEDVVVDMVILPAGETIQFAKQPPLDGVGGNPKIWLQFTDGDGNAVSDEIYLGRCVQLSR
jgi:hypothetical protein